MKILIIGATGFVGSNLIEALRGRGDEVIGISRNVDNVELTDFDAVVNLAGANIAGRRWSDQYKKELYESRVENTKKILSKIKKLKIKTFINASAVGYYGDCGDQILSEELGAGSDFLSWLCKHWEAALLDSDFSGRKVILRIGVVLGEKGALQKMLPAFKFGVGGPLGSGKQWMSWIHVDDLVNIIIFAIDNSGVNGIYNAASPFPVTNREFTKTLGRTLQRPAFLMVPAFILKLLAGEMSMMLLASQRMSAKKIIDQGFKFKFSNIKSALENLCLT